MELNAKMVVLNVGAKKVVTEGESCRRRPTFRHTTT